MKRLITLSYLPIPPQRNEQINSNRGGNRAKFKANNNIKTFKAEVRELIKQQLPPNWEPIKTPCFVVMVFHHHPSFRADTSNLEDTKYLLDSITFQRKTPSKKIKGKMVHYPEPDNSHVVVMDDSPAYIPMDPHCLRGPNVGKGEEPYVDIIIYGFPWWKVTEKINKKGKVSREYDDSLSKVFCGEMLNIYDNMDIN